MTVLFCHPERKRGVYSFGGEEIPRRFAHWNDKKRRMTVGGNRKTTGFTVY